MMIPAVVLTYIDTNGNHKVLVKCRSTANTLPLQAHLSLCTFSCLIRLCAELAFPGAITIPTVDVALADIAQLSVGTAILAIVRLIVGIIKRGYITKVAAGSAPIRINDIVEFAVDLNLIACAGRVIDRSADNVFEFFVG